MRGACGAVVDLLRAIGNICLPGIDDGRVFDVAEGFERHPALVLSFHGHLEITLGALKISAVCHVDGGASGQIAEHGVQRNRLTGEDGFERT